MALSKRAAWMTLVVAALGCGGEDAGGNDSSGGGETGGGGSSTSGAGGGGGQGLTGPVVDGWIAVSAAAAGARFFVGDSGACAQIDHVGSCTLFDCSGGEVTESVDAGTLTISIAGGQTLTLQAEPGPGTVGMVYDADLTGVLPAGAAVDASTTGSPSIPAFSVSAGVASAIAILEPSFDSKWTIDRTHDLAVSWTATSPSIGAVRVEIVDESKLVCDAPPEAGTLTIPSALLQKLPPSDTGIFLVTAASEAAAMVGGGDVLLTVVGNVEGAPAPVVTIQ